MEHRKKMKCEHWVRTTEKGRKIVSKKEKEGRRQETEEGKKQARKKATKTRRFLQVRRNEGSRKKGRKNSGKKGK